MLSHSTDGTLVSNQMSIPCCLFQLLQQFFLRVVYSGCHNNNLQDSLDPRWLETSHLFGTFKKQNFIVLTLCILYPTSHCNDGKLASNYNLTLFYDNRAVNWTPDFEPYLAVSRFMSVISRIIAEVCYFL